VDRRSLAEVLNIPGLNGQLDLVDAEMIKVIGNGRLAASAKRLIDAGGKRLRPALVIAACRAGRPRTSRRTITAAAAVEMVHLASIIHDDIIDGDSVRRGVSSVNQEAGIAHALLLGDFLIVKALGMLAGVSRPATVVLSEAVAIMAHGLDQELDKKCEPFDKQYLKIINQKTAALIAAACEIGAICGGLDASDIILLKNYGRAFGAGFQIIDDVLDGDVPKNSHNRALELIKKYIDEAGDQALKLPAGDISTGLSRLPGYYLETTLKKPSELL
jgi:geranylgeranyl pyrophosphate synthase